MVACVQAAWYWPFGYDEDNTNKPPRLHRLLEKANDFIELAEDESAKGEAEKALDYYRQALDELNRVQMDNPDRAEKPEFAPLRNKIATCQAAMDVIRFEQVNANIREVSVTDTTELQRKWNKKHGIDDREEFEKPKKKDEGDLVALNDLKNNPPPSNWNQRLSVAADKLRTGDSAAADAILEEMAKERPDDLNLLMLRAAALAGTGRLYAARKILEKANRAHPKSYLPYYNLAYVALELGEGKKAARQYYDLGREVGGPVNANLEGCTK